MKYLMPQVVNSRYISHCYWTTFFQYW